VSPTPLDRFLDDFGNELIRAASRPRLSVARPQMSRRSLALATALLIALVATALAASGVLSGAPVRDPYGDAVRPNEGVGAPVIASAHLAALRVADPAGGLPWGMRILHTTRHAGCVQVGRLRDGTLGVLGRDGAFRNDGLFHPLGPDVASRSDCQALDGEGKLYLAMSWQGLPASAWPTGCTASAAYGLPLALRRRHRPRPAPRCARADERILYYGTLGPQARSVSYRDNSGRLRSERTAGREGAYLVVLRSDHEHPARGQFSPGISPASGIVSVTYRDGHRCVIRDPTDLGGARACPPVGYVTPSYPRLPSRPDRTIGARFSAHPIHPMVGPPPGRPGPDREWLLTIRFRAPVTTTDLSSYYIVLLRPRRGPQPQCDNTLGAPVGRSVTRGQVVEVPLYISPLCHGAAHGVVVFHHPGKGRRADEIPLEGNPFHDPVIGRFNARIPPA